jgi:hypothetical protein
MIRQRAEVHLTERKQHATAIQGNQFGHQED